MADRPFVVVIHDVAAPFHAELHAIAGQIRPLVGSQFSCAVVPRWRGTRLDDSAGLLSLVEGCGECLLHGLTHQREGRLGIISKLTRASDEFAGCPVSQVQQRIDEASHELTRLTGRRPLGIVPPAWQLPVAATAIDGLGYVVRFFQLESCVDTTKVQRLTTWSYDWGWLGPAAWAGELMGNCRFRFVRDTTPCVAIHPVDLTRGWMPRIANLIRQLMEQGFCPTLPGNLLEAETGDARAATGRVRP